MSSWLAGVASDTIGTRDTGGPCFTAVSCWTREAKIIFALLGVTAQAASVCIRTRAPQLHDTAGELHMSPSRCVGVWQHIKFM